MNKDKLTKKDLRRFGFLVGTIFLVLFGMILPYLKNRGFIAWPYIVGACFIFPSIIYPMSLKYIHAIWMKIGHVLGYINTRIIAGIMFVFIFTPAGLFMRVIGRDILDRSINKDTKSYRSIVNDYDIAHMERPF